MKNELSIFAIFFIAFNIISISVRAENIYKCGNTYSQTPCPSSQIIQVEDTRDAEQKRQADATTQRSKKLANSLQHDRLAQERQVKVLQASQAKAEKTPVTAALQPVKTSAPTKITPKRLKPKPYKPAGFVALVPGSDQSPVQLKKNQKKKPAASQ